MKNEPNTHKIYLSPEKIVSLTKRYKVSRQTVYLALRYKNNSEIAKKIRDCAKLILLDEAAKITN